MDEISKIQDEQLDEAKKTYHFAQQTAGAKEKQAQKLLEEKVFDEIPNDFKG